MEEKILDERTRRVFTQTIRAVQKNPECARYREIRRLQPAYICKKKGLSPCTQLIVPLPTKSLSAEKVVMSTQEPRYGIE